MTHTESIMLAVCFGAVIGMIIGDLIVIVRFSIEERKAKKREKTLEMERENKD